MSRIIACNLRNSIICNSPLQRAFSMSRVRFEPRQVGPIKIETPLPRPNRLSTFPRIRYIGPTLYGVALSTSIFLVAGTVYDRNQQTLWDRLRHHSRGWNLFGSQESDILHDLWQEKRDALQEKRVVMLERLATYLNRLEIPVDLKRAIWMVGEKLASLTETERTLAGLMAINTVVFGLWQIPRLTPFMSKWFLHLPGSRQNITLLTSCFSHKDFFHWMLNMVGLWSFGQVVHDRLGREQFLAMYLGVGIGANVVSHVSSLMLRQSRPLLPSLGASGAVYGLVASTAVLYPNSSISLIFLPMVPIKLGYALPALMGFDAAGIILKWRMLDHFAHLAGASLGLGYIYYGEQHIWGPLIRKIHEARTSSDNNKSGGNNGRFMWTEPRQLENQTSRSTWFGWPKN